ncbi:MAG TPA: phosphotransferase [Patescibacteria group bacterium]
MVEHKSKLLPASVSSQGDDVVVMQPTTASTETRPAVYGRDLNSVDMILLGPGNSLAKILVDEYSLGTIISCDSSAAFSTTSRKVIVDNGKNRYFIKEKPGYCCTPYSLTLSAQFQAFLSERTGFVPRIIQTTSGDSYLRLGEKYFFTTEYTDGRMFNGSILDVQGAGEALGVMHSQSQEFSFSNPHNLHASEDALQFVDLADQLRGAENDVWRGRTISALRSLVDRYKDQLDWDVPYIVNHGDYAPFNLVYDKQGKVIAVNDFDNVNFRPRTRDLAGAILSFCDGLSYAGATSTLRRPIATSLNIEKTRAFIDGYKANSEHFSEKEKTDLVGEMCIRWTKIMALGIVRGDFNYEDVFNALGFIGFMEDQIPKLI